jgi:hypothetical protein
VVTAKQVQLSEQDRRVLEELERHLELYEEYLRVVALEGGILSKPAPAWDHNPDASLSLDSGKQQPR